jgi:hypothetical protein
MKCSTNYTQFNAADSLPSQTAHSYINIRYKHHGIQTDESAMTTLTVNGSYYSLKKKTKQLYQILQLTCNLLMII